MSDHFVLHSYRRCPFAMRVRIVLELKKVDYSIVEERLGDWTDFLVQNVENPQVPILVHNGRILAESNDINLYLEKLFPEPALFPKDREGQERVRLWWDWCDHLLKPSIDQFKYRDDKRFSQEGRVKVFRLLGRLNGELESSGYLCGAGLTLADIAVIPFVRQISRVKVNPIDIHDFLWVKIWLSQVLDEDFFKDQVMKRYPFAKSKTSKKYANN